MTFLTLAEINSNPIYQPPATWINPMNQELLDDINNRNYKNCKKGNLKNYFQKGSSESIMTTEQLDKCGLFPTSDHLARCGVEVVGRFIGKKCVIGHLGNLRTVLMTWNPTKLDEDDWCNCWDVKYVRKNLVNPNKIEGRSKATTMKDLVRLLMSI